MSNSSSGEAAAAAAAGATAKAAAGAGEAGPAGLVVMTVALDQHDVTSNTGARILHCAEGQVVEESDGRLVVVAAAAQQQQMQMQMQQQQVAQQQDGLEGSDNVLEVAEVR